MKRKWTEGGRSATSDGGFLFKERILPPRLFVAAIAFMIGLHFVEPVKHLLAAPWTWVGGAPALAGLVLNLWADALFKRNGTAVAPFADSTAFITDGPFSFTRNPKYLGMVLTLLGLGILLGSLTPFVVPILFAVILDRRYIAAEEAKMEQTFGAAYVAYRQRVRRWI